VALGLGCQPAAPAAPTAAPAPPTTAPAKPAAPPSLAPSPSPAVSPAPSPAVKPAASPSASVGPSPSPAASGPPPTGQLTIDLEADPESLDPYLSYQFAGLSIHHNTFDYLLERDRDGRLVPGLAESWQTPDDHTLELHLRRGVKFHNGEDFSAESVQVSVARMLDTSLNSGVRSRFTSIQDVKVVDPYTVQLVLSRPDPSLLDNLSNQMAMLPPKYTRDTGSSGIAQQPIGTGPYRFVEWKRDDHLTLEANESYWNGSAKGRPRARTVTFRPVPSAATRLADLRAGQADIVANLTADQAKQLSSPQRLEKADVPGYQYVFFNTKLPNTPLQDKRVRQALNLAVDRNAIAQTLLGGHVQPLTQAVGPLTPGYDASLQGFPFDPQRARALLAEANQPGFSLALDVTADGPSDVVQAVASQLGAVGVQVTIQTLDVGAFNDRWTAHNLDGLFFVRWNNFADPGTLPLLAGCDGFLSFFCSPTADPFMKQAESTLDQAARGRDYQQAVQALNDDPFAIYLSTLSVLYGVGGRVADWKPGSSGYLYATDAVVQ
jgi:peptide/nickel transport system substrate-binding protein